jgi:hypothetical protein
LHFGERFAYYTKRISTLTLHQDHYSSRSNHYMVHPTVLVAWGRQHSLFPRLRELSVCGRLSVDPARDEQALSLFLRAPSLTWLEVKRPSKLCHLTQDSVEALLHACIGLEAVTVLQVGIQVDADYEDALQSWPILLNKMVARAVHLGGLDLEDFPIQWETFVHLAAMDTMQWLTANNILGVPANPSLHVAAPFPALRSIKITDDTPHLRLTHTLFESCIAPHLTSLDITFQDCDPEGEPQVIVQELHGVLALVGRHTGLTSLSVHSNLPVPCSPDADLCLALPPLPHLTHLNTGGWFSPTLDVEDVRRVLALYPRLEHWVYPQLEQWVYDDRQSHAPVSLPEILNVLHPYPSIKALPVFIASADLPSEETIAQFGTHGYGAPLDVNADVRTAELGDVLSRVFPCVKLGWKYLA